MYAGLEPNILRFGSKSGKSSSFTPHLLEKLPNNILVQPLCYQISQKSIESYLRKKSLISRLKMSVSCQSLIFGKVIERKETSLLKG